MNHFSEDCTPLDIKKLPLNDIIYSSSKLKGFNDVCLIILPSASNERHTYKLNSLLEKILNKLGKEATLITIGETIDLVHIHEKISSSVKYQLWVSIKRSNPKFYIDNSALAEYHIGALVHTKYKGTLKHTKTRIKYTYCPACDKTTKDYGGKKHTYNSYGTLISDVWRDLSADLDGDMSSVIERFAYLFGIQNYKELVVIDCREAIWDFIDSDKIREDNSEYNVQQLLIKPVSKNNNRCGSLMKGDVLKNLSRLPDNSVDFAFADPPYNLKKKYNDYADDMSIAEYFEWCDKWIGELARILKPGRTCAVLNIPLWAVRHFLYMEKILKFQNWIVWDALSFPVRFIMPAHYAIICFSKGNSRPLPGLTGVSDDFQLQTYSKTFHPLKPLAEWYCLRSRCVTKRLKTKENDRGPLTDLWWDIHRLKHNIRRVDHPCQLPSLLMYRLISIFTKPCEIVLDCFNGAGTTTLAAHQLGREYIGIELSEKYHAIAESRHKEIKTGLDPFRKVKRKLTEKNSSVERMLEQNYEIPKRTLQLEVRRVAKILGKLPDREEMIKHGKYPIKYYDNYFFSWGEVCAAARHEGMSEDRKTDMDLTPESKQLGLFE